MPGAYNQTRDFIRLEQSQKVVGLFDVLIKYTSDESEVCPCLSSKTDSILMSRFTSVVLS